MLSDGSSVNDSIISVVLFKAHGDARLYKPSDYYGNSMKSAMISCAKVHGGTGTIMDPLLGKLKSITC